MRSSMPALMAAAKGGTHSLTEKAPTRRPVRVGKHQGGTMRGWWLTRRGDYINSELANRTRAAIVSLERSGLWAFVVRTLQGKETDRGRNYPTAAAAMQAAEASTAPAKQRDCGASDGLPTRQRGRGIMSADKRAADKPRASHALFCVVVPYPETKITRNGKIIANPISIAQATPVPIGPSVLLALSLAGYPDPGTVETKPPAFPRKEKWQESWPLIPGRTQHRARRAGLD